MTGAVLPAPRLRRTTGLEPRSTRMARSLSPSRQDFAAAAALLVDDLVDPAGARTPFSEGGAARETTLELAQPSPGRIHRIRTSRRMVVRSRRRQAASGAAGAVAMLLVAALLIAAGAAFALDKLAPARSAAPADDLLPQAAPAATHSR